MSSYGALLLAFLIYMYCISSDVDDLCNCSNVLLIYSFNYSLLAIPTVQFTLLSVPYEAICGMKFTLYILYFVCVSVASVCMCCPYMHHAVCVYVACVCMCNTYMHV